MGISVSITFFVSRWLVCIWYSCMERSGS
uniref:Uncharacterized protein n=1 Tax=Arundo donax TaxID=35708 RepID=A0A0A9FX31_ARUDO